MISNTLNFAILDITQFLTKWGFIIIVTTNNPCHLYLHFTKIEPEKHKRAIFRRGIRLMDAIRYCFVVWEANEQQEPGDTYFHSFIKEPWAFCETRWFTFKGTVNGQPSPSVGPIFKKHRVIEPRWMIFYEPWTTTFQPPDFTLIGTERWTTTFEPPDYVIVHEEPWTE